MGLSRPNTQGQPASRTARRMGRRIGITSRSAATWGRGNNWRRGTREGGEGACVMGLTAIECLAHKGRTRRRQGQDAGQQVLHPRLGDIHQKPLRRPHCREGRVEAWDGQTRGCGSAGYIRGRGTEGSKWKLEYLARAVSSPSCPSPDTPPRGSTWRRWGPGEASCAAVVQS